MKRLNKTSLNYDEMDILPLFPNQNSRLLRKEMVSTLYEYYLVDDIGEPSDYVELCDALRGANENDQFVIRFNSHGGSLSTALMIINAIRETQAHVHGFIEADCASAASILFLACHSYSFSDDATMMIHTSSSMYGGKEHEQHSYVTFSRKKIHKLMRNRYSGFLTESEIENVLNGQDYYFDADAIADRLDSYTEYHQKMFEEEMERLSEPEEPVVKKKKLLS